MTHWLTQAAALALTGGMLLLCACRTGPTFKPSIDFDDDPSAAFVREFRGAWIPTVNNINWPSQPGLSTEEQQRELLELLDTARRLGLNAVILQVRTAGDALYESEYEPWSEYLTGEMGRAPEPYYDPLAFAVEQAHARGLELHAWFNPFRARYSVTVSEMCDDHLARARPDLVRRYGRHLWMDPGEPEVRDLTVAVVMDVVRRYDIDGVHFDDYFYPYPETDESGTEIAFDDEASWQKYLAAGGTSPRDQWRRANVNEVVMRLSEAIAHEKPHVLFGISPFGIWRPGNPPGIEGFDQYDRMFADPLLWLKRGWIDYLAPQLYWPTWQTAQAYEALLEWWVREAQGGPWLLVGNAAYRAVEEPHVWGDEEYARQMRLTRQHAAAGEIHYYLGNLHDHPSLAEAVRAQYDGRTAIPPDRLRTAGQSPERPVARRSDESPDGGVRIEWDSPESPGVRSWLLAWRSAGQWQAQRLYGPGPATVLGPGVEVVALYAIGPDGRLSPPALLK